jgi:ABC-type multidrug transport system fused ATPase/permease subunit
VAALERRKETAWSFSEASQEPLAMVLLVLIIVIQVRVFNEPLAPVVVGWCCFTAQWTTNLRPGYWQLMMQEVGSLEIVEEEMTRLATNQEATGTTRLEPLARGVRFDSVTFRYGEKNVLEDIEITIPANGTVAIVGESGAGKTTLADLLTLILRPQIGHLTVDGVPHDQIEISSWREQIGMCPKIPWCSTTR